MTTRLICWFDELVHLASTHDITSVLFATTAECYWGVVCTLEHDGRLWAYLSHTSRAWRRGRSRPCS